MFKWIRNVFGPRHMAGVSVPTESPQMLRQSDAAPSPLQQQIAVALAEKPSKQPFVRNVYRFVGQVLDDMEPGLKAQLGTRASELCTLVTQACHSLHDEFLGLNSGGTTSYASDLRRFAYVYAWLPCHARQLQNVFAAQSDIGKLFDRPEFTVLCIGGGPGTELLAIADHMAYIDKRPVVRAVVCDSEPGWQEYRERIADHLSSDFQIHHECRSLDIKTRDSWLPQLRQLRADLYVVSYCVSELLTNEGDSASFFSELFDSASPGALFVFVDVSHTTTFGWIDALPFAAHLSDSDEGVSVSLVMGEIKEAWDMSRRRAITFVPNFKPSYAYRIFRTPYRSDPSGVTP